MLVLAACGSVDVLVAKIIVCVSMEFGLDACGLVLAAKIGACGSIEMGFDACGLVLVAEISACGSTKSMLVGFDSYGACGGELI